MRQFGICLETADFLKKPDFVDQILKIVKDGIYDFVQLIVFSDSYDEAHTIIREKMQDIRTVIHAPFYDIDMGNRDLSESNLHKLKDAQNSERIYVGEFEGRFGNKTRKCYNNKPVDQRYAIYK
jgi:hypothetical protein